MVCGRLPLPDYNGVLTLREAHPLTPPEKQLAQKGALHKSKPLPYTSTSTDDERYHWRVSPLDELWLVDAETGAAWGAISLVDDSTIFLHDPCSWRKTPLFETGSDDPLDRHQLPGGMPHQFPLWATPAQLLSHARDDGFEDFLPRDPMPEALEWPILSGHVPETGVVWTYQPFMERFFLASTHCIRWSIGLDRSGPSEARELEKLTALPHPGPTSAAEFWVLYLPPDNNNFVWWPVEIVGSTAACLTHIGSGISEKRMREGRIVGGRPKADPDWSDF